MLQTILCKISTILKTNSAEASLNQKLNRALRNFKSCNLDIGKTSGLKATMDSRPTVKKSRIVSGYSKWQKQALEQAMMPGTSINLMLKMKLLQMLKII